MDLEKLLTTARAAGASDVLITAGSPLALRVNGVIQFLDGTPLDGEKMRALVSSVLSEEQVRKLTETRELDFSLTHQGHRFRGNAYWQGGRMAAALRLIPDTIPRPDQLGIPKVILQLVQKPQGLLLVTGASDQGKTTTQASLVDLLNRTSAKHIITIEDPIEFVHHTQQSIVDQREVGSDTLSFSEALRHALRESPDVILVGEMRDLETVEAALHAAETGHLVIPTLHTNDACQALDRIIAFFPEYQQGQVRAQLSRCLLGVLAQRLVRDVHRRLLLAAEVLINVPAVSNLIREGKTQMLYGTMETSTQSGMQTMNQTLNALVEQGAIHAAEAERYVSDRESRG